MTQNEGQNFGSSSRALGAFDQRGPYGILIHLGVDFVKMNESQFRAENPAAKYPLPYRQQLLKVFSWKSEICWAKLEFKKKVVKLKWNPHCSARMSTHFREIFAFREIWTVIFC